MKVSPFKALFPKPIANNNVDSYFNSMSRKFNNYVDENRFNIETTPLFYIYTIQSKKSFHKGIVVANDIEDFQTGNILKHETIIPSKTAIIRRAIAENQHQIKPLLLGYKPNKFLNTLLDELILNEACLVSVAFSYGEEHKIYCIKDQTKTNVIIEFFSKLPEAFIADGHHRSEATQELINRNINSTKKSILCAYFAFDNLRLLPFHRSIGLPKDMDQNEFIDKLSNLGELSILQDISLPPKKHTIHICLGGKVYSLKWNKQSFEKYDMDNLPVPDTLLINELILENLWELSKIQLSKVTTFIGGNTKLKEILALSKRSKELVMFILHPENTVDLSKYVLAGKIYPPKTTWFEPKIRSGMIAKSL